MKVIIKKWIAGRFVEVKSCPIEDVKEIRHHKDGLEVVFQGHIQVFDNQCVVGFEKED